jgi:hypothetical protein
MKSGRPSRFTEGVAIALVCLVEEGLSRKAASLGIGERLLDLSSHRGRVHDGSSCRRESPVAP